MERGSRAASTEAVRKVRFAGFEVNLRTGELRRDRARIKLQDQPFRVLAALLSRPGDLITREELRDTLWPSETFVDFEDGLNTAIRKLRVALGDTAGQPRFIETIPRRGYRFIHSIEVSGAGDPEPVAWWRRTAPVVTLVGVLGLLLGSLAVSRLAVLSRVSDKTTRLPITSIAVLPLRSAPGNPGQRHLADGITDALITELGRLGGPRVISFQSVLRYRDSDKPLPEIARDLKVQAIVEGSLLREGGRISITAQLVHASPEEHLWSSTFTREISSVLHLQSEVSRAIAHELHVTMLPSQGRERPRALLPEAHDAFVKGRDQFHRGTPDGILAAKTCFEAVVRHDPQYAQAYSGLAELYVRGGGVLVSDPLEGRVTARKWAKKALELDDTLAEAHTALAWADTTDWDWVNAERGFRRALALNPSYSLARVWYAEYLAAMRRFEEALDHAAQARLLDPASPYIHDRAAWTSLYAGRVQEAMAGWRKVLDLEPTYRGAFVGLGQALITQANYQAAVAELERVAARDKSDVFVLATLAYARAKLGRSIEARELAVELEARLRRGEHLPLLAVTYIYVGLGDFERAFFWLEKQYHEHRWMYHLSVNSLLAPLRSDPRFADLVRRVGLPPYPVEIAADATKRAQ